MDPVLGNSLFLINVINVFIKKMRNAVGGAFLKALLIMLSEKKLRALLTIMNKLIVDFFFKVESKLSKEIVKFKS